MAEDPKLVLNTADWLMEVEPWQTLVEDVANTTDMSRFEAMAMVAVVKLGAVQLQVRSLADAYNRTVDAQVAAYKQRESQQAEWRESQERYAAMQARSIELLERLLPIAEREVDDMEEGDDWKDG